MYLKNHIEYERNKREREEKAKAHIKEKLRIEEIEKIRNGVRKKEFDKIKQ